MMKERILQIMRRENMTQQEFAKAIEVSPASLSNIFNGKTNPTNNHVSAIHRRFPDININWLMFGEGDMYTTVSDETKDGADGGESTIRRIRRGNLCSSTFQILNIMPHGHEWKISKTWMTRIGKFPWCARW